MKRLITYTGFAIFLGTTGCTLRLARDINLPTSSTTASSALESSVPAALVISPGTKTLMAGNSVAFSGSGGALPYTFSLVSGTGSIDPTTGLYTAAPSPGSATIRLTDGSGQSADASVSIVSTLVLTPPSITVTSPSNTSFSMVGSGGGFSALLFSRFWTRNHRDFKRCLFHSFSKWIHDCSSH